MTNGRKNVIATLEGQLFEDQPDNVLISKATNEFLHVNVPLCFENQRVVWVRQDCNLEPAAKRNLQSSPKQEAVMFL